jgi:F0F1-type ATP synthase membrane subunit c/vacuolar-type H+-ATPase subunit K
MEKQTKITLSPRNIAIWLSTIAVLLLVAHLITIAMPYILGGFEHGLVRVLFSLFFLDGEGNLPAIFSTWLFLINAVLFLIVWKAACLAGDSLKIWLFLSGVFVFLAVDESISIHERLIDPLRQGLDASGIFYYTWIIPYGIGVVLLSIFAIPVFWRMQKKIRFWFGLSAATYLFATIGLEMISGKYLVMMNEKKDIVWILMITLEEFLEMVGLIILVYALLLLLRNKYNGFLIFMPGTGDASQPSANQ